LPDGVERLHTRAEREKHAETVEAATSWPEARQKRALKDLE
jgi:hypothetical protein